MLGLEIFFIHRSFETMPSADIYLQEIKDTCIPLKSEFDPSWTVCSQEYGMHPKWNRYWRIWTANYPYGWLKEIAYSDLEKPTKNNFYRIAWVTLFRNKMPTRNASFKFWWWLKNNGIPTDFSTAHPIINKNSFEM